MLGILAIAALAALAAGCLALLRPPLAMAALVLVVYANASEVINARIAAASFLLEASLALAVVAIALGVMLGGPVAVGPPVVACWLGLYTCVILASSLWAAEPSLAASRGLEQLKQSVIALVVCGIVVGYERGLRTFAWAVVVGGTGLAALGVVQVATGLYAQDFFGFGQAPLAQIAGKVDNYRISGPFGDPNFFAQTLLVAVPFAWGLARTGASRSTRGMAGACGALCAIAVVLTYSRGALVALALIGVLEVLTSPRRARALGLAIVVAVIMFTALPRDYGARLSSALVALPGGTSTEASADPSIRGRSSELQVAVRMFADHPLGGVGAGNYPALYLEQARRVGLDPRREQREPHNLFLEVAAETGVVGLVSFTAVVALGYVRTRRASRQLQRLGEHRERELLRANSFALVAFLVTGVFLHAAYARMLTILLAVAIAAPLLATRRARPEAGEAVARGLVAV